MKGLSWQIFVTWEPKISCGLILTFYFIKEEKAKNAIEMLGLYPKCSYLMFVSLLSAFLKNTHC